MEKKYYPDLVQQEYELAQPDIHWYCDFSEINIKENNKLHLFLVIDGCYNEILKFSISKSKQSSTDTIRILESAIKERRIEEEWNGEPKLIIHSDRGSQFTSDNYFLFTNKYKKRFRPSMSPMASPKHNAVMERFIRTFKNLKINNKSQNLLDDINTMYQTGKDDIKEIRKLILEYVEFYNEKKKTEKAPKGANFSFKVFQEGKEFVTEPLFTQGYSEYSMRQDLRRVEINKYKDEVFHIWSEINEVLPENVSFLEAKPVLLSKLRVIETKVDEQYQISLNTQLNTEEIIDGQKITMSAIGQVASALELLRNEVQELKGKRPLKKGNKIQLRDAIYHSHYEFFMIGAGQGAVRIKTARTAQLRIIYTLLYHLGLRLNETKMLTKKDIILAVQTGELNIIHTKTNTCQKHILPIIGKQRLAKLRPEIELIFDTYGFEFLGNSRCFSTDVFNEFNFIRLVNEDMILTCKNFKIISNFSSHSFRVGYITKLLKTMSVQKVASIIGHRDIESTMSYQRYIINKEEIQESLKEAFQ
jgi:integrase